ncbi:MAG: TrmB family transcriptional regulator, partial [Candidatus Solibacter usitatus]|nr:TrmB family transcriptional regulator [Candidatus Solibacter usitatus]
MANELPDVDFEKFWRRLQQAGLNAYEARSYLVLVGHPRFKALELAARARVPRQKIYEVLDSLVEKGFAQVVQEKTKLFSAVEPGLAIPAYIERQKETMERQVEEQRRHAQGLAHELKAAYAEGQGGRGTLDYLRIVNDPSQMAVHYRSMLSSVEREYVEFSRPPYAVDPLDEHMVKQAAARGVRCRIL